MSWFFTKAALMTFGGAYAVLPYVYQGAVTHYGWLTAGQMMDGLALGESTPGPLIMVVTFVGFVGGYTKAAVNGAVNPTLLWVVSINGPPARIKINEGKKVNHVTRHAAAMPPSSTSSTPNTALV